MEGTCQLNPSSDCCDVELISQWPPPSNANEQRSSQINAKSVDGNIHQNGKQSKRLRRGHVDVVDNNVTEEDSESLRACSSSFPFADAALASWWRKEGRFTMVRGNSIVNDLNSTYPPTLLCHLATTIEGQKFLHGYLAKLKHICTADASRCNCSSSAHLLAAIATTYEKLGEFSKAEICLLKAISTCPLDGELRWLLERVSRQLKVSQFQKKIVLSLQRSNKHFISFPESIEIDRQSASLLSVSEFLSKYCERKRPVIITGMKDNLTRLPWNLMHIDKVVGDERVILKKMVDRSVEWAKLENACEMTVSQFINELDSSASHLYLFDWSLPVHCVALASEIIMPKYFEENFILETEDGSMYKNSWPSLFIAPAKLCSELHVDANGTHFWMMLFEGLKKWTIFPPEDLPYLYPRYSHTLDPVFDANLACPNLETHPLLAFTHPSTCVLHPGEVLFVPAGSPHRVENLEKSLAVSGNFVNRTNIDKVICELKCSALVDQRSEDLVRQLETIKESHCMGRHTDAV